MRINRRKKAKPNFRGFLPFHRTDKELISHGGPALLGAYYAFVSEADWDPRRETVGCILKTDGEIAESWDCNTSTVARYRRKLIDHGRLEIESSGYLRVKNFERFDLSVAHKLAKYKSANVQEETAKLQEILAEMPDKTAKLQENRGYNWPKDFKSASRGDMGIDLSGIYLEDETSGQNDETEDLLLDIPV
ncbi:MAG: hypothetical protein UT84_C0022G0004 [Candidatus Curtissbacteria bacterium GW2011_GWA1_40_16]|uniref:Uncharacterized protein n=1 Tax=Candidatus Curtissbacteria bacterium GW2011_GWA1_40_16 TaxID=1618405 RepID=A0A0G0RIH1_9BACT|nr:MAG: hypothetical protein UT84_C0022G0004 [Candidatus Curtissbacteria bacterium GW2011_GWA1_40_16]